MPDSFRKIGRYQLNAVPDVPDFRDYVYEPALLQLAKEIKPPRNPTILDQGKEGACTGFGLAAVINMLNRRRARRYAVSPRMLYEMARRHDEWPGEDYSGSSCRGAIKGWYAMGVCRESHWEYVIERPGVLTVNRAKRARENTVGAYYRVKSRLSDYHAALNETGALFVSANVHAGWRPGQIRNGVIPFRKGKLGGHAFAIVGYNADGFVVQNSWGKNWGRNGLALWNYEDWHTNVRDAWVFRLGLPSSGVWHLPPNEYARRISDPDGIGRTPPRGEIAGHYVHIDDGRFHEHGRYWSNLDDVRETAELVAKKKKYKHLLVYAHGGLNGPKASARRIAAMKEVFKENEVYPYHFMYDTGLGEELRDVVFGRKRRVDEQVRGFFDGVDKLIERLTRVPGRAVWREMKDGARTPFLDLGAGTAVIKTFMDAFARTGTRINVHLVGHSTGGILLAHLIEAMEALVPTIRIASCSLLAPAATVDLFKSHYYPYLVAPADRFGIDRMAVYNLNDRLERRDNVAKIYRKSLLYLVSRAFEENTPRPLLGMQRHSSEYEQVAPGVLEFIYSRGRLADAARTAAEKHGGFDNDPLTMNDVLGIVLGRPPRRPFTKDDLDY